MASLPRKITVIGLGVIGGSLCRAFRRSVPECRLSGVDFDGVLGEARRREIIDAGYPPERLAEACTEAEIVFLATPISESLALLKAVRGSVPEQAIVTDVCSLKREIMQRAGHGRGIFIGGHPMAGSEGSGLQHADPFLFENALYVLTPEPEAHESAVTTLADLLGRIGAHVVLMEAELHDRIAASVSHLPQMLAVALMLHVAEKNRENALYLKMAAGGFRDMTRIASSPYFIWRDICAGNRAFLLQELDAFAEMLQKIRRDVESGELQADFDAAARYRLSIPSDTRGFLSPHFDLSVEVEDRPGVIAAISVPLAEADINIKDIEVLKVRENEGGTIRLAFASRGQRAEALRILTEKGFRCQER